LVDPLFVVGGAEDPSDSGCVGFVWAEAVAGPEEWSA